MSDETTEEPEEAKKSSKLPLILGLIAALAGGGGGFYAAFSGMILGDESPPVEGQPEVAVDALPDVAFVPVDPMMISLGVGGRGQVLRFRAQLEVPSAYKSDVELLLPRVVDVLNSYLRALEAGDIESPAALTRLRAQMLRRVQVVAGNGRINDLLIMEFVLT